MLHFFWLTWHTCLCNFQSFHERFTSNIERFFASHLISLVANSKHALERALSHEPSEAELNLVSQILISNRSSASWLFKVVVCSCIYPLFHIRVSSVPLQGLSIDLHCMAANQRVCHPLIESALEMLMGSRLGPLSLGSESGFAFDDSMLVQLLTAFGPVTPMSQSAPPVLREIHSEYTRLLADMFRDGRPDLNVTIAGQVYQLYDVNFLRSYVQVSRPDLPSGDCVLFAAEFNELLAKVREVVAVSYVEVKSLCSQMNAQYLYIQGWVSLLKVILQVRATCSTFTEIHG